MPMQRERMKARLDEPPVVRADGVFIRGVIWDETEPENDLFSCTLVEHEELIDLSDEEMVRLFHQRLIDEHVPEARRLSHLLDLQENLGSEPEPAPAPAPPKKRQGSRGAGAPGGGAELDTEGPLATASPAPQPPSPRAPLPSLAHPADSSVQQGPRTELKQVVWTPSGDFLAQGVILATGEACAAVIPRSTWESCPADQAEDLARRLLEESGAAVAGGA